MKQTPTMMANDVLACEREERAGRWIAVEREDMQRSETRKEICNASRQPQWPTDIAPLHATALETQLLPAGGPEQPI
jgi:hypothetical protein